LPNYQQKHANHGSSNSDPIATLFFVGIVVAIIIGVCHLKQRADQARKERNEAFVRTVKLVGPNFVDRANDGCPVYVKGGQLQVDGPPADPKFQMPTRNEVFLKRKVEVYCWKEQLTSIEESTGIKFAEEQSVITLHTGQNPFQTQADSEIRPNRTSSQISLARSSGLTS